MLQQDGKTHQWLWIASNGSKSKSTASATRPKKSWRCDEHGVIYQVVPRFNVILRVIDEADSGSLVMFDTNVSKICNGISAFEVMNKHGENTSDYFMDDLNETEDGFKTPESNSLETTSSGVSALDVTKFSLDTPLNKDDALCSVKVSRKRDMIDLDDCQDIIEDAGSNKKPFNVDVRVKKEE
nr:hypothetical protein [Tanacetum cinerariifolium]